MRCGSLVFSVVDLFWEQITTKRKAHREVCLLGRVEWSTVLEEKVQDKKLLRVWIEGSYTIWFGWKMRLKQNVAVWELSPVPSRAPCSRLQHVNRGCSSEV